MSRTTFKKQLAADVAAAGTFTLPYVGGLVQADFTDPQTVTVEVYTREFECAISFGASEATVTWPAGAPYALPAGEYYIDVDLVGGDPLGADVSAATNIGALTNNAAGTPDDAVADVSTAVTGVDGTGSNAASKADVDTRLVAIDENFADLAAKYNTLLANMKAAGLMEPDA